MSDRRIQGRRRAAERAGSSALSVLAIPQNVAILQLLGEGPAPLAELRQAAGLAPEATLRSHVKALAGAHIVERLGDGEFPGTIGYELTPAGHELLEVARVLGHWLTGSPRDPVQLGSEKAKRIIGAVVDSWASGVLAALASRPHSLTELDTIIPSLSYPALERRLLAMRQFDLLEAVSGRGRSTPQAPTDWLRLAIGPIAAATRWEHRCLKGWAPPIADLDIEAAFHLALPLLSLPESCLGSCRLAVKRQQGSVNHLVSVIAEAEGRRAGSRALPVEGRPNASAVGLTADWFSAVGTGDLGGIVLSGDRGLARNFVEALHRALSDSLQARWLAH